ncbi:uncharacterized protein LOC18424225 [Amborella trichopoda]|uniref:uncharacterized protein LOC18424225 n=1 Tax=Amborella trichopoda TaxID=13333 RepID=UPI0009C004EF|nr:uncharacterized protein LOC18424225 [Amborella trichopoda]|eukprot:XP_020532256.1 uncharacterized protein LOC18424225 [Amborella trichopoda]
MAAAMGSLLPAPSAAPDYVKWTASSASRIVVTFSSFPVPSLAHIAACDKPGAVCQDPRFIGGDGITFYFHGKKDKDFCLVSDSKIHINGHFIGKTSPKQKRDFTWVQAIGLIFGSHHLYLGAQKASRWDDSIDHISLSLNGEDIEIPTLFGATHIHKDAGLKIWRLEDTNSVIVNAKDQFKIKARVLPITQEDSRTHGYEITNEDCFSHLEVNFRFYNLSTKVDGVLGQTYAPGYQSRVLVGAAMPIMGGARRFESSHIFSTDCLASKFEEEIGDMGKWKLE